MKLFKKILLIVFVLLILSFAIEIGTDGQISEYIEDISTPISERYPNLPEEYKDNILLESRNKGSCRKLEGEIEITFIFINEGDNKWNDKDRLDFKQRVSEASEKLTAEVQQYGKSIHITEKYTSGDVSDTVNINNAENWYSAALIGAGIDDEKIFCDINDNIESPVFFCINRNGRSFAQMATNKKGFEYSILYFADADYRHELLHLFGAVDLYFEDNIVSASDKYFPNSIMKESSGDAAIDDLNAYLVCLTDKLSDKALSFLADTMTVSHDSLEEARKGSIFTGEKSERIGEGTYTGYFYEGIPNGEGTLVWDSGDTYSGSFLNGQLDGYGTITWASGDKYEGDWKNGIRNGYGTYYYADGTVYKGQFTEGKLTGTGTMTWIEGDKYEGDWVDGNMHGKGTYTYNSGSYYVGDFVNGHMEGNGTIYWTSGESFNGEWKNDDINGYGTYTFKSGRTKTGYWADGEFIG